MGTSEPVINDFTSGELSDRMTGKIDSEIYARGCKTLENFIVCYPTGSIERRPGTRYVCEVADSAKKTRLVSFVLSQTAIYILEFSNNKIRFIKNNALITTGTPAVPVSVTTTYTEAQLFDLKFVQVEKELYIVHPSHEPAKLTYTSDTSWSLANVSFTSRPFTTSIYPSAVTYFENRIWYGGTEDEPMTIWGSQVGLYDNFSMSSPIVDTDAVEFTFASIEGSKIQWMEGKDVIIVGTLSSEWIVTGGQTGITPANVMIKKQSVYGSSSIQGRLIEDVVVFTQRSKKRIREYYWMDAESAYKSPDLSRFSDHITGDGVREFAYQSSPFPILWVIRTDGELLGLTYSRLNGLYAWHRHTTEGEFESVCVSPTLGDDEVWVTVKRTIGTSTKRYVEYMSFSAWSDQSDAFYLDSGVTYDSTATTTMTGLTHLEGETVSILADGAPASDEEVTDGEVTLSRQASVIHAGLNYRSIVETMNLQIGGIGKTRRITKAIVRLYKTLGGKIGTEDDETHLSKILYASFGDHLDSATPLYTGDKDIPLQAGYEIENHIVIVQDQPLPMTVLAISPKITTYEGA